MKANRSSSPTRIDVPVAGGSLAAFLLGPRDQHVAPVLAVHGITSNSRAWVAVSRRLEADRGAAVGTAAGAVALLAVDLRGRGASNQLAAPYGLAAYARDLLAVLDHCEIERTVVVGHSLGAYLTARLAAEHPDRVQAAVLVDGGLRIPGSEGADPQAFLESFLGPAVARLRMRFDSREAYRQWWRAHPALAGNDVDDADLAAWADHDLVGEEPELHSAVAEEAVRADAADLFESGDDARRLTVPTTLLCAPRGLLDDPNPMQPVALARGWAAGAPELRQVVEVPDVNHYTIVLGAAGAGWVAEAISAAVAPQ